jgi:signal transduction histidine kinase
MKPRFSIWFIYILFLGLTPCAGQHPGTKNFTVASGLPSNETYNVYQDTKGFVWIATDNGVVKFDGLTFETFKIKEGLEDPVVFGITEDKQGNIWFRTFSGKLFLYANGKINPWQLNGKTHVLTKNTLVSSFAIDSLNNVWLGTNTGKLIRVDSAHVTVTDSASFMITLIKEVDNTAMVVFAHVLSDTIRINEKKYPVRIKQDAISNLRLAVRWNNKIYISVNGHLFECNGSTIHEVLKNQQGIINLHVDNENHLWIGYNHDGAQRFSDDSFANAWRPPLPKGASVTSIFQDRDGGFWITTLEKGIYYLPELGILNYAFDSKIKNLTTTPRGLLLNTYSESLIEIDTINNFSHPKISSPPPPYDLIFQDHNQNFWIEGKGLFVMDKNFKLMNRFVTEGANASAIFEDGKKVYALSGQLLSTFNNYRFEKVSSRRRDIYRSIIKTDSLFLIAGRLGLSVFNDNLIEKRKIGLFNNIKIACLKQLNDSLIAIGTLGYGVYLYNKNSDSAVQFHSEQKFLADNVYSILFRDSILWMGTEKGVAHAHLRSLLSNEPKVTWITADNGLISNKINQLAFMGPSLWAFSDEGGSCIPLTKLNFRKDKFIKFYIKDFLANGVSQPYESTPELRHNQNNIKIRFGFISLQNQDIKIRYKLQVQEPWQYTTERIFEFSSLSPGAYQLMLQFSVDNFSWIDVNSVPLPRFVITPPWWQMFFFQITIFAIAWALIFLFFRNRIRYYRQRDKLMTIANEHQQQLINSEISTQERERERIAKELHDSVGTDLSALKLIISQNLQKNSNDVEEQLQSIIHEIKNIIYELTPPGLERFGLFKVLKNYIEKLNPIGIQIQFDSYGDEIKDFNTSITIFRIIQELISNSLKHSSATNITITINSFPDLISILYEDNGIGFNYDSINPGLGLQNIESRIKLMQGTIAFDSSEFGICYTIDIPVQQSKKSMV